TRGYRMSAESRNNWRLALSGASEWSAPYRLSLGGKPIGAGDTVDVHAGAGLREDSYAVGLVLQDVSRLRAGLYTDLVTLSVAPLGRTACGHDKSGAEGFRAAAAFGWIAQPRRAGSEAPAPEGPAGARPRRRRRPSGSAPSTRAAAWRRRSPAGGSRARRSAG